ncbi:MAG TPA: FAD-dependent oxidoreductase [Chthoniobacterales bacterium]|nr:FAD-dependent oxidoreductase [Chthoniobacterales bacterium]
MSGVNYSFPIVILGGGFAGAYCARSLRSGLGEDTSKNVALLADQNAMLFHPMLAEVSGSSISPLHVVNPLRLFCKGSEIFMGAVDEIDLEQKTVTFSPAPSVTPVKLTFDHLVLAIGSVVDVSRVPGMPEHGYLMKTVGDAMRLRSDVLERLEAASVVSEEAIRRKLLTFVIVGGGYSGVETAGQIWDLLRDVQRLYPRINPKEFSLVLVHSGSHLLPQIGEELGKYCEVQLRSRGIEVRLNTRVNAITSERAILNTGDVIETNTVVTTVGNATNPVIKKLIDRYHLANEKGRLITDPTMQVKGYKDLWSAGDCAAVPLKDGSVSPATAQFAMRQGTLLGKNIIAARNGQTVVPFRFKTLGEMASIGHRNAVGKVLGFKVSGFLGWLMWRATYLYKLPGLEQKSKVFFEWSLELLFPRDISLLNINMTEVVGRVHLEKGDPIYHIGDSAFSFYLIEQGHVEVDDHSGATRKIGPGEHFGERELLQKTTRQFDATALESTTLLALNKTTFEALTKNSLTLGYFLNRSSVKYLNLQERRAIVDRASPTLRQKRVEDLMRRDPVVLRGTDSIHAALKAYKQAGATILPLVADEMRCTGWVRLDLVLDWMHQGKARLDSLVSDLRSLPFISVKPEDSVEEALLQFTQTPDREVIVSNDVGQLVGTLALLDLILADHG